MIRVNSRAGLTHSCFHCCFRIHGRVVPHFKTAGGQRQRPTTEKNISKPELVRHNNWKEKKKIQINKVFTQTCLGHVGGRVNTSLGVLTANMVSLMQKGQRIFRTGKKTYGRATSKRFSISLRTFSSSSLLTKEIERPLVPKRPARPTR